MNDKIASALDKFLGVNTSAFLALGALCVSVILAGYYVGQIHSEVTRIGNEHDQLCLRIKDCIPYTDFPPMIEEAKDAAQAARHLLENVQEGLLEAKARVTILEQKLYNLITYPAARPNAFTNTDGDELRTDAAVLRARIKSLEMRLQNRQIP